MPDTIRCPDCGQENPADRPRCGRCDRPLRDGVAAPVPPVDPEPVILLRRPVRRPRPRPVPPGSMGLWALAGAAVAATLVYYAYTDLHRRGVTPVEGATAAQQRAADSLLAALDRDSTDLAATIAYGNILYDTANWAQAARYYERALARDSGRVQVLVDLGVCWYNQGAVARAERLFQLALRREPGHAVALFNLGVVREGAGDDAAARRCFERSLAAGASGAVARSAAQRLQAILQRTGRTGAAPRTRRRPGGGRVRAPGRRAARGRP